MRTGAGTICVSLFIVTSGKFSGEHRCAKGSHSEPAFFWSICCVGVLGAVTFSALILLLTCGELMLLLHSVIH